MTTLGPNHGLRNPHLGNPHLIVVVVSMNKEIRSTNSLRVVFLMYYCTSHCWICVSHWYCRWYFGSYMFLWSLALVVLSGTSHIYCCVNHCFIFIEISNRCFQRHLMATLAHHIATLRWQNAHLQAEIRHYQSALSSTKMELQIPGTHVGEQWWVGAALKVWSHRHGVFNWNHISAVDSNVRFS